MPKPRELSSEEIANFDGVVLDVRSAAEFGAGHIPNSINIGLSGKFATWAGTFIAVGTPLAIFAETEAQVEEAFMRLARVGLESVTGYILRSDYTGTTTVIGQVPVAEVYEVTQAEDEIQFVDVRQPGEYGAGHAYRATNLPLNTLDKNIDKLDPSRPTFVICQTGYRSSLATSILENAGFREVYNVAGGTSGWLDSGLRAETDSQAQCAG
jgi:rhodanese-related sulfurtransferase